MQTPENLHEKIAEEKIMVPREISLN